MMTHLQRCLKHCLAVCGQPGCYNVFYFSHAQCVFNVEHCPTSRSYSARETEGYLHKELSTIRKIAIQNKYQTDSMRNCRRREVNTKLKGENEGRKTK
jgi:hypothetical protein